MTDHIDDLQLVRAYHEGSKEAFRTLFDRHKRTVFNFALRFIGNRADAEDVVSDVFLQLFLKKFVPTGEAKLGTWLFALARNGALNRMRTRKQQISFWARKDDGGYEEWEFDDHRDSVVDDMKKREMAQAVKKAIAVLPEEQREVIILREYHQKSYGEIAEIADCSLEKVKILIFRARESLRVALAHLIKEA